MLKRHRVVTLQQNFSYKAKLIILPHDEFITGKK